MSSLVALISGPVASGKTSVASLLLADHGFDRKSSGDYLRSMAARRNVPDDRRSLQDLGDALDQETDYEWVVTEVARPHFQQSGVNRLLFDAVRKRRQVEHFRRHFDNVLHVHIEAPESVIAQRYVERAIARGLPEGDARGEYRALILHQNEVESRSLREIADLIFDTNTLPASEIAGRIAAWGK